jgi:hypothetical protein
MLLLILFYDYAVKFATCTDLCWPLTFFRFHFVYETGSRRGNSTVDNNEFKRKSRRVQQTVHGHRLIHHVEGMYTRRLIAHLHLMRLSTDEYSIISPVHLQHQSASFQWRRRIKQMCLVRANAVSYNAVLAHSADLCVSYSA